jgi:hypothetical protein
MYGTVKEYKKRTNDEPMWLVIVVVGVGCREQTIDELGGSLLLLITLRWPMLAPRWPALVFVGLCWHL